MTTQKTVTRWFLKEVGYGSCLRCYGSTSKYHNTSRTPCVVRINLMNVNLTLTVPPTSDEMLNSMLNSTVSTVHLQGPKTFFPVVRINRSRDVKIEIPQVAVSVTEKSQPLTKLQIHLREILKLEDQIVDLQDLKARNLCLRNLLNQS